MSGVAAISARRASGSLLSRITLIMYSKGNSPDLATAYLNSVVTLFSETLTRPPVLRPRPLATCLIASILDMH